MPSGDYDLILDGIHENMLQLHYHDPVMRKTVSHTYNKHLVCIVKLFKSIMIGTCLT